MRNIEEVGFLEKGTGKHQSNIVYGAGGCCTYLMCSVGYQNFNNDFGE